MAYSAVDYLKLLASLLPKGRAWNRHFGRLLGWGPFGAGFGDGFAGARMSKPTQDPSTLMEVLAGQAEELARVDQRSHDLLTEKDTRYTTELLIDHEADFGLPDACMEEAELTVEQRRHILNLKLRAIGQQDKDYFEDLVESLGYGQAYIEEFRPAWSGVLAAGEPCGNQDNIFYWKLWLGQESDWQIYYFCAGQSECGAHLRWLPLAETIDCLIAERYKPAHTQLLWGYYGYQFGRCFDFGFLSLPPMQQENIDGLYGGFNAMCFGLGFDIAAGGGFGSSLGSGFSGPAQVPPSLDPQGGEIIIKTDASGRDGEEAYETGTTNIVRATVYMGRGVNRYLSCFQYEIPWGQDVVIEEATLVAYWSNRIQTNRMMIYVEDADDAAAITAGVGTYDISSRDLVGSGAPVGVEWVVEPGPDAWLRSPNFGHLIQQVINRPGWSGSQYVSVIVYDNGSVGD